MNGWTTCPHCGLSHSIRADGACPRCHLAPGVVPAGAPGGAVALQAGAAAAAAPLVAAPAAKPKATPLASAGGVAGALIGIGASRFFGAALLFPGVFAIATALVLVKVGPARARPFTIALSALVGHLGWMVAGALFTGSFGPVAIDLVVLGGCAAWLAARPGLAPVIVLAVPEVLAAAVNGFQLSVVLAAADRKALVLHLLLRVAVLAGLVVGYRKLRVDAHAVSTASLVRTFE